MSGEGGMVVVVAALLGAAPGGGAPLQKVAVFAPGTRESRSSIGTTHS